MALEAWTDERLDDLATALRPVPAELARVSATLERVVVELTEMREEMREMRAEFREEMRSMRSDFAAQQRQIAQIGWAMFGTTVAGIIAIIVALG